MGRNLRRHLHFHSCSVRPRTGNGCACGRGEEMASLRQLDLQVPFPAAGSRNNGCTGARRFSPVERDGTAHHSCQRRSPRDGLTATRSFHLCCSRKLRSSPCYGQSPLYTETSPDAISPDLGISAQDRRGGECPAAERRSGAGTDPGAGACKQSRLAQAQPGSALYRSAQLRQLVLPERYAAVAAGTVAVPQRDGGPGAGSGP